MEMSAHSHHSVCKIGSTNGSAVTTPSLPACGSSSRDGGTNEILTLRGGKGVVVRWKRKEPPKEVIVANGKKTTGNSTKMKNSNMPCYNHYCPQGANSSCVQNYSQAIRSTYTSRSIESKKKVIRMLFVLVVEFFVCWSPLYVVCTF